jgi:mannose-6-phosphate isomerase
MIQLIHNVARNYAWGSRTMFESLGIESTGEPMAEIWFGTHHGSPSVLKDDQVQTLESFLGGRQLPFLLKLLAAEGPLSIQAHPNSDQALAGFAREEALGIPHDSPSRNYKDGKHKPEMVVALSDEFHALCGFRSIRDSETLLRSLSEASDRSTDYHRLVGKWLDALTNDGLEACFHLILEDAGNLASFEVELLSVLDDMSRAHPEFAGSLATVTDLAKRYPGDVGVVLSLLMNHAVLEPGQALFLPAGNIHAYLYGLAVEVMAASDNVIRGGLTPKHIDVDELCAILDFTPRPIPYVEVENLSENIVNYPVPVSDFTLARMALMADEVQELHLGEDNLVLCVQGSVSVTSLNSSATVRAGEAAYVGQELGAVHFAGEGVVFIAGSGTGITL